MAFFEDLPITRMTQKEKEELILRVSQQCHQMNIHILTFLNKVNIYMKNCNFHVLLKLTFEITMDIIDSKTLVNHVYSKGGFGLFNENELISLDSLLHYEIKDMLNNFHRSIEECLELQKRNYNIVNAIRLQVLQALNCLSD